MWSWRALTPDQFDRISREDTCMHANSPDVIHPALSTFVATSARVSVCVCVCARGQSFINAAASMAAPAAIIHLWQQGLCDNGAEERPFIRRPTTHTAAAAARLSLMKNIAAPCSGAVPANCGFASQFYTLVSLNSLRCRPAGNKLARLWRFSPAPARAVPSPVIDLISRLGTCERFFL